MSDRSFISSQQAPGYKQQCLSLQLSSSWATLLTDITKKSVLWYVHFSEIPAGSNILWMLAHILTPVPPPGSWQSFAFETFSGRTTTGFVFVSAFS